MKRAFNSRIWFVFLALILIVVLAACERPLQDEPEPTPTPAMAPTFPPAVLPTVPVQPTTAPGGTTPDAGQPTAPADAGGGVATPVSETGPVTYVVQPGDTLYSIAQQYAVSAEDLAAANGLNPNDLLVPGQSLTVPVGGVVTTPVPPSTTGQEQTHVVQAGENLFRIGLQYGCSVNELAAYNGIANPDWISVGQVIRIPPNCTGS